MTRGPIARGDTVVVCDIGGANSKSYPLAPMPKGTPNYSYERVSDQIEAEPDQPLAWPLTFHGGLAATKYDPDTAYYFHNSGVITEEPYALRAPAAVTDTTLTGSAAPPTYFFETEVNDSGSDDGEPILYVIGVESDEVNIYKITLSKTSATAGRQFGRLCNTKTITVATTTPMGRPAQWTVSGTSNWYLGLGDNGPIERLDTVISGYDDSGSANEAVTTTDTTLTDTRKTGSEKWGVNAQTGYVVTCNSKTLTVTSNTSDTLTGTGGWSGGGNPGDGKSWTMAATDTWTASADADARHLCVVGNQLYRTTGSNEVCILDRDTDPMTEANWGTENYVGDAATNITDIAEASGTCYMTKEDGFYEWDGIGTAENVLPEVEAESRNGQGMVYWHGGFLIPTAAGLWWTRTGKLVGFDSNPSNRGKIKALGSAAYPKRGRWMGLVSYGEYVWGLYLSGTETNIYLVYGRERDSTNEFYPNDPTGWGPIIWHVAEATVQVPTYFSGIYIAQTSVVRTTYSSARPTVWYPATNDLRHMVLDSDGGPFYARGEVNLDTSAVLQSGEFDFRMSGITKQLRVIEGWAEDMAASGHSWQLKVRRDGGSSESVGAAITSDGFFERFWTQGTNDTAHKLLFEAIWAGSSNLTNQNGPLLHDLRIRAVAKPDTTPVWTFLIAAEDKTGRTAKAIRSELEGYIGSLKTWELPDGDTFNGVLGTVRLLRNDEMRDLTERMQDPPRFIFRAEVREMVGS